MKEYKTDGFDKYSTILIVSLIWIFMTPIIILLITMISVMPWTVLMDISWPGIIISVIVCAATFYCMYRSSLNHLRFSIILDEASIIIGGALSKKVLKRDDISEIVFLRKKDNRAFYKYFILIRDKSNKTLEVQLNKDTGLSFIKSINKNNDFHESKKTENLLTGKLIELRRIE